MKCLLMPLTKLLIFFSVYLTLFHEYPTLWKGFSFGDMPSAKRGMECFGGKQKEQKDRKTKKLTDLDLSPGL